MISGTFDSGSLDRKTFERQGFSCGQVRISAASEEGFRLWLGGPDITVRRPHEVGGGAKRGLEEARDERNGLEDVQ